MAKNVITKICDLLGRDKGSSSNGESDDDFAGSFSKERRTRKCKFILENSS